MGFKPYFLLTFLIISQNEKKQILLLVTISRGEKVHDLLLRNWRFVSFNRCNIKTHTLATDFLGEFLDSRRTCYRSGYIYLRNFCQTTWRWRKRRFFVGIVISKIAYPCPALLCSVGYEFNKHFLIGTGGDILSAAFCINMFHIVSFLFSVTRTCDSTGVDSVTWIQIENINS